MAANNYILDVSPLTGTVYIQRVSGSKRGDKRAVSKGEMVPAIVGWVKGQLKNGDNVLVLTDGRKPIAEIKILR